MTTGLFHNAILGPDTHANRPAATACPWGTVYKCTTHNMIEKNDAGTWIDWASLSGGASSVLTTKGDLLVHDGSALACLPVGTDGQVLTADSTQPDGVKWAAGGGGGGSGVSPFALDPATLHATYGDHFTGSSLAAKWSRAGSYVAGDETYQQGGGTFLKTAQRAAGSYYYQAAPAGDFSLVMAVNFFTGVQQMFGLMIVDNSGNGVGGGWYNNAPDGPIVVQLVGAAYDGAHNAGTSNPRALNFINFGVRTWYKLVKSGTSYSIFLSTNGSTWSPWALSLTVAFTPTRIGFGTFYSGSTQAGAVAIDFFDVQ